MMNTPVRESIMEVDPNTWLIGTFILHRSSCPVDSATWKDDIDGSSYTLTAAPTPRPSSTLLSQEHPLFKKVYDVGNGSAVWSIGSTVFCKVHWLREGMTPEATTLDFVRRQRRTFRVPELLQHCEHDGRSILFLRRVPGKTLMEAWPSLTIERRQYYVTAIANICKDLAELKGSTLGGVDGRQLFEPYLLAHKAQKYFSLVNLRAGCEAVGLDCSTCVFYHPDLGPGNIIVDGETIGIIDWEGAGFFPRGWVRSKFQMGSGMDFENGIAESPYEWRVGVYRALGDIGFETYGQAWLSWRESEGVKIRVA